LGGSENSGVPVDDVVRERLTSDFPDNIQGTWAFPRDRVTNELLIDRERYEGRAPEKGQWLQRQRLEATVKRVLHCLLTFHLGNSGLAARSSLASYPVRCPHKPTLRRP
jgi:hypothetical protein